MKLVYVAGPYSAPTRTEVLHNIAAAERLGVEVAKLGAMPVIPHSNTGARAFERAQPYSFWIVGTLELMRRCDAVILLPNWELSSGARGERADALARRQPVFETLEQLAAWLEA